MNGVHMDVEVCIDIWDVINEMSDSEIQDVYDELTPDCGKGVFGGLGDLPESKIIEIAVNMTKDQVNDVIRILKEYGVKI